MNIPKLTYLLVSVFNDSGFAELLRGIWQARVANQHVIHGVLLSNTYVRYSVYTQQLRDGLRPGSSMDEQAFIRWLVWSEFGQTVLAIVGRPRVSYSKYCNKNSVLFDADEAVCTPLKNEETDLKRLAVSVFLFVLRDTGRAQFHHTSGPAVKSNQFTPDVIEAMDDFANGRLSEHDFFAVKYTKNVFAPDLFYQQLTEAAGYVIDTCADYFKK